MHVDVIPLLVLTVVSWVVVLRHLPTERYVEYNDPGIGAHTDIAMNRDEIYP